MQYQQLVNQIKKKRSFLCVGLDSDINKLPACVLDEAFPVFAFNKTIIDATKDMTVSYKLNVAFYEALGVDGWKQMEMTVAYCKEAYPDIFIIADAKRGDIGNTSELYARTFFETLPFDAVTVTPYMGEDSVRPFLNFKDKWVILLALTSNKGNIDFQMMQDVAGEHLYEKVVMKSLQWGDNNNMMYVVGATKAEMLADIRKIIPKHFLLVPGVGAQGGSLKEVIQHGATEEGGLLINSSRGIIFADSSEHYAEVAREKAKDLQNEMQKLYRF